MTVYGTRPEAIKVATIIAALERDERFESIPVVTGQHREMLDQVNTMFGITPKHDLDLMKPGQALTHRRRAARCRHRAGRHFDSDGGGDRRVQSPNHGRSS
jgi:hypothetical protein